MFEYRVEIYGVKEAEKKMNAMAAEGWRVITIMPNIVRGHGMIVTFEREKR